MRQIFQDLKTGETRLAEVPRPSADPGQLLIRSHASLVCAGTERMLVELGKAGLMQSGAINLRPTAEEGLVGRGFSAPEAPIPFEEIMEVSRVAIEAAEKACG